MSKWWHKVIFSHGYHIKAAHEMLEFSEQTEFFEAAQAIKEQIILFLIMYKKTNDFPMLSFGLDKESYRQDIEKLCKIYERNLNKYQELYGAFHDFNNAMAAV